MAENNPLFVVPVESDAASNVDAILRGEEPVETQQEQKVETQEESKPQLEKIPEVKTAAFAALKRKERALYKQQEALKVEREQLKQFREVQAAAQNNPAVALQMLEKVGLTPDQIISYFQNPEWNKPKVELSPADKALAEVAELKRQLASKDESSKKEQEDAQVAQREEMIAEVKADIESVVSANPERYELLQAYPEQQDKVFSYMERFFKKTGKEMSYEDACDTVENEIQYDIEQRALTTKKFGSRLSQPIKKAPSRSLSQAAMPSSPIAKPYVSTSEAMDAAMKILETSGWTRR